MVGCMFFLYVLSSLGGMLSQVHSGYCQSMWVFSRFSGFSTISQKHACRWTGDNKLRVCMVPCDGHLIQCVFLSYIQDGFQIHQHPEQNKLVAKDEWMNEISCIATFISASISKTGLHPRFILPETHLQLAHHGSAVLFCKILPDLSSYFHIFLTDCLWM